MRLHHPGQVAIIIALSLIAGLPPVCALTGESAYVEPDSPATEIVLTVPISDYSISGLVTHSSRAKAFKYGIALFPGYSIIYQVTEEELQILAVAHHRRHPGYWASRK